MTCLHTTFRRQNASVKKFFLHKKAIKKSKFFNNLKKKNFTNFIKDNSKSISFAQFKLQKIQCIFVDTVHLKQHS